MPFAEKFTAAACAILALRSRLRWKPGSELRHLLKRKSKEHLPPEAAVVDYRSLIRRVLVGPENLVYYYPFREQDYYAVVGEPEGAQGARWLVMFRPDGILETAFPPTDVSDYVRQHCFLLLGRMREVMNE